MAHDFSLTRRDWLKRSATALGMASVSGWFDALALKAVAQGARAKACIMLWMDGGPSQSHTFDPKPPSKGYENPSIDTAVPGIRVSESMPLVAEQMKDLAVLRTMTTAENDHGRAHYLARTGYRQGVGGFTYPHLGAVLSSELGRPESVLPNFVVVQPQGYLTGYGVGALHPCNGPVMLRDPARGFPDLQAPRDAAAFDRQLAGLDSLDVEFLKQYQSVAIEAHRSTYQQAVRMIHSAAVAQKPFKLEEESEDTRKLYGDTQFGKQCLLARRLIEAGVLFVEVMQGGWDSHGGGQTRQPQAAKNMDRPFAALIADLKQRGLLDTTLVIWMGEFGRDLTGNTHKGTGGWTTVLGGGGLKTGQVIGKTGDRGAIEDRPITISDYLATIHKALGVDYTKNYLVQGRPIGYVDKNPGNAPVQPVEELFA